MPIWFQILVGLGATALISGLGYILARLDKSVTALTAVTTEQGKLLMGFQERTKAEIKEVRAHALAADRQSAINETEIAEHGIRLTKLESEHNLYHKH